MPDINEWVLGTPGQPFFELGSIGTSDYPLSVQVVIGDTDREVQDQRHPTSDGVVMGKDSLGGFEITFDMKILPVEVAPLKWDPALDLFGDFVAAWRADGIRNSPGVYCELYNTARDRMVFGRPRKCSPKLDRLRKGLIQYVATFETNSPDWYSAVEHSTTIDVIPPSVGSIITPVETPVTTANQSAPSYGDVENAGNVNAWPIIEIYGPGSSIAVSLYSGVNRIWTISVPTALKTGQVLVVDTQPWSRSAILNGTLPANGRIRGTQLENCFIPPGVHEIRFDAVDPSGTSYAVIKWRDAYASM